MKIVSRRVLLAGVAVLWALCSGVGADAEAYNALEFPYNAADRSQLFVDKLLVHETDRVWFTQHQGKKHPANPVIIADKPWEGWRLELFGTVLYDEEEKLFKIWYLAQPGGKRGNQYFDKQCVTCYATSKDGIHWEKPLVGTIPSLNGKPHNAVGEFYQANVLKETNDPDPARRYKAFAWIPQEPYRYIILTSPDGLKWKILNTDNPNIISDDGDLITAFWDHRRERYVAFTKTGRSPTRGLWRRVICTNTSKDLLSWSEPVWSWKTDSRDDVGALARIEQVRPLLYDADDYDLLRSEYYGVGFYLAESCTIGFPWILTVNNNASRANGGSGGNDGPQEIQLGVSRDLYNWQRPFRTPVVEIGRLDQWDASYQSTASQAIRFGDEIRLYYSGGNYTHGTGLQYIYTEDGKFIGRDKKCTGSIGLVTWLLDRFVSVDGPAEGGTLKTVPMCFTGNRLVINAATKGDGNIVVEILDAGGRPLDGFPPSEPFSGDDLRHVVTFGGKSDVSKLIGRPVTLKFHIKDASLYSFAFRK